MHISGDLSATDQGRRGTNQSEDNMGISLHQDNSSIDTSVQECSQCCSRSCQLQTHTSYKSAAIHTILSCNDVLYTASGGVWLGRGLERSGVGGGDRGLRHVWERASGRQIIALESRVWVCGSDGLSALWYTTVGGKCTVDVLSSRRGYKHWVT